MKAESTADSSRILELARSLLTPAGWRELSPGHARLARAGVSTIGMVASKVLQVSVSIITVPLMLTYLGREAYGLAMAIIRFCMLFSVGVGVSEGVKLRLIECFSRDDRAEAKAFASTGFFGILALVILMETAFTIAFPFIDWPALFSLSKDTPISPELLQLTIAFTLFLVPPLVLLMFLQEVFTAFQRGYVVSLFVSGGTLCSLAAICVAIKFDLGLLGIVLGLQSSLILGYIALWIFLFFDKLNWLLPRWSAITSSAFSKMWLDCLMAFFMSVGFIVINGTDIFIVNHYLGQSDAATFAISVCLFIYIDHLLSLILYPLWPALGEAIQKGERQWARKVSARMALIAFCSGSVLFLGVLAVGRPIIVFWTRGIIHPPLPLHLLLGVYYCFRAIAAVQITLLRAHGRIRFQCVALCGEAVLHLVLCIFLVQRIGLIGVVIGGILAILLTRAWVLPLEYRKVSRTFYCTETPE